MSEQNNNQSVTSAMLAMNLAPATTNDTAQPSQQPILIEIPHSQAISHAAYYRRKNATNPVRRVSPIQSLLKHYLERSKDTRRAAESKKANAGVPLTNFLALPVEIRETIYGILFVNARLTYNPQGIIVNPEDQWKQFRRENMWTSILHVCSKIREEAIPVFVRNLTFDAGYGGQYVAMLLTPVTRLNVRQVFNFNPATVVATFPGMTLWKWEVEGILNERFLTSFVTLDSRAMFERVLVIYQIDDFHSTVWLGQGGLSQANVSFLGKLKLGLCYLIDDIDEALLHLSSEADQCNNAHDLIGHVYLNFVERRAIFDMEDERGEEACMRLIT